MIVFSFDLNFYLVSFRLKYTQ